MTSEDEMLRRLRALSVAPGAELEARVGARASATFERATSSPQPLRGLASVALVATVLVYVGWAIDFAIALYR